MSMQSYRTVHDEIVTISLAYTVKNGVYGSLRMVAPSGYTEQHAIVGDVEFDKDKKEMLVPINGFTIIFQIKEKLDV